MGVDWIVCLANSYKHDHRCVAGINLTTKKWVRLVGREVPGCVTVQEASYANGKPVAPLDLFEVELGDGCGSCSHPEDTYITSKKWKFIRRFDQPEEHKILVSLCSKSASIFQSYEDRIYGKKFEHAEAVTSLELLQPDDLWWWVREENGKRKNRALFRMGRAGRARYDLAVTDPVWLEQLSLLPAGVYPHAMFCGKEPEKPLLVISLSEPFQGFHYKLVAGVVQLSGVQKTVPVPGFIRAAKPAAQEARPHRFHFRWHARHS